MLGAVGVLIEVVEVEVADLEAFVDVTVFDVTERVAEVVLADVVLEIVAVLLEDRNVYLM